MNSTSIASRCFFECKRLFSQGDKILVAVSGGVDSVVCAHLIAGLAGPQNLSIAMAYIHHHLRDQADQEQKFVADFADALGVPFYCADIYPTKTGGLQAQARALRYDALENLGDKNGYNLIATAHNLDDQAETVLFRALRGSGLSGLAGIPRRAGKIIRPLLFLTRQEIEEYAAQNDLEFMEDHTNAQDHYTRNRIRHHALPMLSEILGSDVKKPLARLGRISAMERTALNEMAFSDFQTVQKPAGLDVWALRTLSSARRLGIYRLAIEKQKGNLHRIEFVHLAAVDEILFSQNPSAITKFPENLQARRQNEFLIIEAVENSGLDHDL